MQKKPKMTNLLLESIINYHMIEVIGVVMNEPEPEIVFDEFPLTSQIIRIFPPRLSF